MTSSARMLAFVFAALSCRSSAASEVDDDPRYLCRVDVAPLRAALRAAGGDPARILRPTTAAGLLALTSGHRHKFVLNGHGMFVLAPLPADAAHNEYVHPILGDGAPVRGAGGMTVVHVDGRVTRVVLDAESFSYCTATESLRPSVRALQAMGIPAEAIVVEARPLACAGAGAAPKRYGAVMVGVGRRFETLGRALAAGGWELADYEMEELAEDVDELPGAAPPPSVRVDLVPTARAFPATYLAPLAAAVARRDAAAATAAYGVAAGGCYGCHQAAGKVGIMVSPTPGDGVPWITPSTTAGDGGVGGDAP